MVWMKRWGVWMQRSSLSRTRLQPARRSRHYSLSLSLLFSLSVEAPAAGKKAQAPSFTQKPSIQQLESSVIFSCACTAVPQPTVTWYKETTVVKESSRHKISIQQDGDSYVLSLQILVSTNLYRHLRYQPLHYIRVLFTIYPSNYYILLPFHISLLGLSVYFCWVSANISDGFILPLVLSLLSIFTRVSEFIISSPVIATWIMSV